MLSLSSPPSPSHHGLEQGAAGSQFGTSVYNSAALFLSPSTLPILPHCLTAGAGIFSPPLLPAALLTELHLVADLI